MAPQQKQHFSGPLQCRHRLCSAQSQWGYAVGGKVTLYIVVMCVFVCVFGGVLSYWSFDKYTGPLKNMSVLSGGQTM